MCKHAENRRQVAKIVQKAYPELAVEEVRRGLDTMAAVKRKEARVGLIQARSGRSLTIDALDFKPGGKQR